MRVLVTGGAGFIGSHVVDQLLAAGATVRVVDSLDPAAHDTVPDYLDPAADLLVGDIADPTVAMAAVDGVDAVCHQAAKVGLGVDFGDVGAYVANNDTGTACLLEALWRRSFRGRLVLASSMVVYGEGRYRCEEHGEVRPGPRTPGDLDDGRFDPPCPCAGCARTTTWAPIDESAPLDPRNVYAATKVHQEHLCALWGREAGAIVVALRYHNVYGPRMPRDTPYAGVASIFRSALAGGRAPEVYEDGGQTRDFVHVRDVARANVAALTRSDVEPGAYNIASGTPHTVGDLARALAGAMAATATPASNGPGAADLTPVVTGRWRLGDVRHVVASPTRAERALGFVADVDFAAGMVEFAHAPRTRPGLSLPASPPDAPSPDAPSPDASPPDASPPDASSGDGCRVRPVVLAGFLVAAAVGVGLSAAIATGGDIIASRWSSLVRLAAWSVVWVVAVACALRLPRRVALGGILLAGVALRLAALVGPPVLSDDFYRHAWDGRVQAAGINPYRYTPTAPELRALREPWLWPDDAGCARLARPPECTLINRPTVRTIYPPLAQAWFAAVHRVGGDDARHKAWQVAGLVGDLALLGLLPLALRAWGRDERWTTLYALSPFPVVEVVNNGHLDGLAAVFIVAGLLAAARRKPAWAGALVGGAALIKLYPAVLLVGLAGVAGTAATIGRRRTIGALRARWSPLIRGAAAAAAVVAVGYLPHVIGVGAKVLGYLPGYLREENYDGSGRYLLAGMLGLPGGPTAALAAAGLGAVGIWVLVRRPDAPRAGAALLGGLLLATTPVQPWYAVTLVAVAAVAARPAWTLVAAAGYPYFYAVILAARHTVAIGRISYGLAFVAVLAGAIRRRAQAPP